MTNPFFFGYGSLVNRATHSYGTAHPARISGWRRVWRHVTTREVAFLTAYTAEGHDIDGLIAEVPDGDWQMLDEREFSYIRDQATGVTHPLTGTHDIQIYHAPPELHLPALEKRPILLSYLDAVVQGYLSEFGETGVRGFFDTTDGWDAPIRNDRAAPIYKRHQRLSPEERALADSELARVGAEIAP